MPAAARMLVTRRTTLLPRAAIASAEARGRGSDELRLQPNAEWVRIWSRDRPERQDRDHRGVS